MKIYEHLNSHQLPELINNTQKLALEDGVLPRKIKLLIAMALDAVHGASDEVQSLAKEALKAGATKEEITEAL